MKTSFTKLFARALLLLALSTFNFQLSTFAQGTAFTYQGRLTSGTNAATGIFDLRFAIYDAVTVGTQQGNLLTNSATAVTNGLFAVTLDFGNQFPGANRWLEIAVRTNGAGVFTNLAPRQKLTPTPYAIYAVSAATAASASSVAAANITGIIPAAQLPATVVTNGASGVNFSGTFSGSGAGMTNLNLAANSGGAVIPSGTFVLTATVSAGVNSGPEAVTAADVNGDGKPDIIVADFDSNRLTVLTNNGSGGFVLSTTLFSGSQAIHVTSADVNGDSKVDLISVNNIDSTLVVFTNNGSGGFSVSATLGVDAGPSWVVAADVNGDTKVDLISANYQNSNLTVLTNNGTGGFVFAVQPTVGSEPRSVTAADVNGDGRMDLISGNATANTLTVLTNNGSGGFGVSSSPGASNPHSVMAADVNGDGKPDLISGNPHVNPSSNTVTVLTNNGSGGFVLASTPNVGYGPYFIVATDVNGDGRLDLISANYTDTSLSILLNQGNGNFALAASPFAGDSPSGLAAADFNGDGRVDLVNGNYYGDTVTVFFNTPTFTGVFTGNGSGLTALNATNVTGILNIVQIPSLDATKITTGTIADARLSANVALRAGGNIFTGNQTMTGLLRSGSETGTSELPSPAGLVMRRINSTVSTSNSVVAAARNNGINLIRDGTAGGFQISYPVSPGFVTIACIGIDNTGVQKNFYVSLPNPASAGVVQIYTNSQNVVHFECTFGITFNSGEQLTSVTLTRYVNGATFDNYWSGHVISTFNQ